MAIWFLLGGLGLYAILSGGLLGLIAVAASGTVSQDLLNQIEGLESFRSTAYPDGSANGQQLYSIGYGHQIQPSESYLLNTTITQQQAEQLLTKDLQAVANILNGSGINYTQGQYDALLDFGFNAGLGALMSAVEAFINSGSDGVVNYLQNYVYWHPVPGGPAQMNQTLVNRRNNEIAMWNS